MIDVLVVGGYLGAGKTSLVNHLLRTGTGRRTLVLVNDFGKVAVEDELVASRDAETLTLVNGCVCCSLASPLIETFVALRERSDRPELVVLETSGVADPGPVSHHAMIPGFRLAGVVVVADAETVRAKASHQLIGRTIHRQLAAADVLVLNKTDLVAEATLASTKAWLAAEAPRATLVEAAHGKVPVALLVDVAPQPAGDHHHDDEQPDPHLTVTWHPAGPVDRSALLSVLADPGLGVVRAKGTVRFTDRPADRVMVQAVSTRVDVAPAAADGDDRLVLIGLPPSFDADAVLGRLAAVEG